MVKEARKLYCRDLRVPSEGAGITRATRLQSPDRSPQRHVFYPHRQDLHPGIHLAVSRPVGNPEGHLGCSEVCRSILAPFVIGAACRKLLDSPQVLGRRHCSHRGPLRPCSGILHRPSLPMTTESPLTQLFELCKATTE